MEFEGKKVNELARENHPNVFIFNTKHLFIVSRQKKDNLSGKKLST
jgi:hypothetical protein